MQASCDLPVSILCQQRGLISYAPDSVDQYRRAAVYVDRILRGEEPADLPVEQSAKIALAINLKTAHALGLEVPPTLLTSPAGRHPGGAFCCANENAAGATLVTKNSPSLYFSTGYHRFAFIRGRKITRGEQ